MIVKEYKFNRLCFKADIIEPLKDDDIFIIHTPTETYQFTKADFYQVFSNVVKTKSYQEGKLYHYPKSPQKAKPFLIRSNKSNR